MKDFSSKLDAICDSLTALGSRVNAYCARNDATPEQIEKVRRLYERPGTPGEKAAAAAALRRFGVDPTAEVTKSKNKSGSKWYRVTLQHEYNGETTYSTLNVEADDEIEAEMKARGTLKKNWKSMGKMGGVSGKTPEFRAYSTKPL